ncbi:alpha/beta fold hydrolase [Desulfopila aestuarii]|uniref:Pimeloyl-ACP methyl ester carboxylesterase n=1 Tax=Desulfopila aestuarii DSM 18488 TaxID=1121416 RepID=A0A1M7XXL8_9BACT|nr:alpha/beta hydrolase [Desulfopila aestuarii]SHO43706.1 Pimeloyl-ACP methyl ester carboxylesterase [Desulfopila aestuarii DSM 18488]
MQTEKITKHQDIRSITRAISSLTILFAILFFAVGLVDAKTEWPKIVSSQDGTPISYEIYGAGEPTLVFVHGWSCDARYWREQLPYFSKTHRVVLLDLAGHGHSGSTRSQYSMRSFGEDVQAVTEATGSRSVILIGHSMGGVVIAEAARLMPDRVKGLIGVDKLENVEYPLTKEELEQMIAPMKKEFQTASRAFVQEMILPSTDSQLREWILADMSAAQPSIALSAMEEMMSLYVSGQLAELFDEIHIPVRTVNGDLWPIDYEANRRHMVSYDAIIIKGADHFLMMDRPDEFNQALESSIDSLLPKPTK